MAIVEAEKNVLDPEVLKTQESLSDEQRDALHLEATKAREEKDDTEDKDTKDEDDKAPDTKPEKVEKKDTQKTAEETDEEDEDPKKADEELLKKPDEALSKEEKTKKAELIKQKTEFEFTQEADALSKEKNISVDDAKKELQSYNKIAEKYKNSPKEMAKALLSFQREFNTTKEELKKLKEAPRPSDLKPGEAIINGKVHSAEAVREILVDGYREEHPEVTEGLDDDKVYQLAVVKIKEQREANFKSESAKLSVNAKEKRSKVMTELSDNEKDYSDSIQSLVNETPDHVLMDENWSFEDVKSWARGKHFTNDKLEEIRKEAFKKGREEAEILGIKEKGNSANSSGKAPAKAKTVSSQLTKDEQERARNMYRTEGLTDEQKFEMFLDFKNHQEKKNK